MSSNTTYALAALPHSTNPKIKVINLRITTNRRSKYKSLGINIQSKNWDKKNHKVYSREPNANIINEKIEKILLEAQLNGSGLVGKKENDFLSYADEIIDSTHTPSTKHVRSTAIKKLRNFMNGKPLQFKDINNLFIEKYQTWLLGHREPSTANEYMQALKELVQKTQKSGKYQWDVDPFINYKRKKTDSKIEVLDDSDLKLLINHTPPTPKQKLALNIFFFMMYLSGIRIGDALKLTFNDFFVDDKGRLMVKYQAQKNGQYVTTRVSIEAGMYMLSFLGDYTNENTDELNTYRRELIRVKEISKEYEEKWYGIRFMSNTKLFAKFQNEGQERIQEIIKEQADLEKQRNKYSDILKKCSLQKGHVEKWLNDHIKKHIMTIKKNHPTDTVLPHLRGIYKGEPKISEEVTKKWHSAKTNNNKQLKLIGKNLGIKKKITNHQARHVFAMRLFLKGVNIHHISLALGHSSIQVTDIYRSKLIDNKVHDVVNDFSETFRELEENWDDEEPIWATDEKIFN